MLTVQDIIKDAARSGMEKRAGAKPTTPAKPATTVDKKAVEKLADAVDYIAGLLKQAEGEMGTTDLPTDVNSHPTGEQKKPEGGEPLPTPGTESQVPPKDPATAMENTISEPLPSGTQEKPGTEGDKVAEIYENVLAKLAGKCGGGTAAPKKKAPMPKKAGGEQTVTKEAGPGNILKALAALGLLGGGTAALAGQAGVLPGSLQEAYNYLPSSGAAQVVDALGLANSASPTGSRAVGGRAPSSKPSPAGPRSFDKGKGPGPAIQATGESKRASGTKAITKEAGPGNILKILASLGLLGGGAAALSNPAAAADVLSGNITGTPEQGKSPWSPGGQRDMRPVKREVGAQAGPDVSTGEGAAGMGMEPTTASGAEKFAGLHALVKRATQKMAESFETANNPGTVTDGGEAGGSSLPAMEGQTGTIASNEAAMNTPQNVGEKDQKATGYLDHTGQPERKEGDTGAIVEGLIGKSAEAKRQMLAAMMLDPEKAASIRQLIRKEEETQKLASALSKEDMARLKKVFSDNV